MKTIILSMSILLSGFLLNAQSLTDGKQDSGETEGVSITVNVPVKTSEGSVVFGLYDESTFMSAAPLQGLESEIVDGLSTVTFADVEPGVYAIVLFHDKNGNKQMDFDPNGMPLESYGTSNNDMSYGPPLWDEAKFEVGDQPLTLDIIM